MQLSNHDLSQLDEEELLKLPEEALRRLSIRLLNDLKEARERLNRNSRNSSQPPSSEAPWEKERSATDSEDVFEPAKDAESKDESVLEPGKDCNGESIAVEEKAVDDPSRRAGKQPGAQGFGRQQSLPLTAHEEHIPQFCVRCDQALNADRKKAWTAFDTVDIERGDENRLGVQLSNTRHTYYEISCACGHTTRMEPYRNVADDGLPSIFCGRWRLVGPELATLIVCPAYRMRLARELIAEFLEDWLGLQLAVGTINNTIHASGAAAMPVENEPIQTVKESPPTHGDETSWMERTCFLWLWVFSTASVTAYWIASRSAELVTNLFDDSYSGWLMSDGYRVYRNFQNRLRCRAHLMRKAQGLKESLDRQTQRFGTRTLELFGGLMTAVQEARGSPPDVPLTQTYQVQLADYRCLCEQMQTALHKPTRALANEMLNDWQAIFRVLQHPELPLTNNEAERALRHWVILRKISYGTRTEQGSRVFAILISVIETCRKRQQSPWIYLATVIRNQRAGLPVPKLPVARGSE